MKTDFFPLLAGGCIMPTRFFLQPRTILQNEVASGKSVQETRTIRAVSQQKLNDDLI
jgi:hypothetical protein